MNQPMPIGKRIVSKGAYIRMQGKRFGFKLLAIFFFVLGVIVYPMVVLHRGYEHHPVSSLLNWISGTLAICFAGRVGVGIFKKAQQIDPGIPITRATTADLPAPESLLRASEEPTQKLVAVLLRPAVQGQETPSEQLVRAVGKQELL